jgi:hypothetical protein
MQAFGNMLNLRRIVVAVVAVAATFLTATAQAQNVAAGQALYVGNGQCQSCHGSPQFSSAGNARTVAALNNAINSQNQMQFLNQVLSNTDKTNIVAYINSVVGGGVSQQAQTVTFPVVNSFAWNTSVTLNATASSGLGITYSVSSGPCTVSGSLLSATAAGICNIRADQAGNTSFLPASASRTVTTNPANQTITFPPIVNFQIGGIGSLMNATASSGLPVTYTLESGPCLISGSRLIASTAGTCSVMASQAGNANYFPITATISATATTAALPVPLSKRGGVDIDGSGRAQIIVRNTQGTTLIGRLSAATGQFAFSAGNDPGVGFRNVGLVDFDGDGRSDLAFQNMTQGDSGEVLMWKSMQPSSQSLIRSVRTVWNVEAVGDLDGDGIGDLVWRFRGLDPLRPGDTGVSYVWFLGADGKVAQVKKRGGASLDWTLLGAADLNGDGAADMVYISPQNQIRVLVANGQRSCANFAAGSLEEGYTALKLADFLNNGRAQVLALKASTNELRLIELDGTNLLLPPPPPPLPPGVPEDPNASCTPTTVPMPSVGRILQIAPAGATFYAADDFDGDGFMDIVWRAADRTLIFWKMNGSASPVVNPNAGAAP